MTIIDFITCPVCDESFSQLIKGDPLYTICYTCRQDFGCTTATHVDMVLGLIKNETPDTRKAYAMSRREHNGGHSRGYTPPPKVDQEKVNAGIRSLTRYGLTVPLSAEDIRDLMPTNYVMAANGLFEVRHSDIADVAKALSPAGTAILGLTEKLTEGVFLNVPKVPFALLANTVAFFRGVVKRFNNGEAIVRIWWNVQAQTYEIRVPDGGQRVSGASVHHNDDFDLSGERGEDGALKYLHVMDIHSHNSMNGFWSGIDDNDEKRAPEGRMFGVLGKVTQTVPDWKWRMRSRGDGAAAFIDLKVTDIFEIPAVKLDFTSAIDLSELLIAPTVTATMTCTHDPFKDATCPEAWYATVNQPTANRHEGTTRVSGFGGMFNFGRRVSAPATIPSYIFILSADGTTVQEHEVLGETTRLTGKAFAIVEGTINPIITH